jgi:hypothetical protein
MKKPKTLPEANALIASKMRHRHDANRADVYEKFRAIHGADVRESDAQAIISGRGGFSTLGIACEVLAALDEVPAPSAPAASAPAASAPADKPWANGLERAQYRVDAAVSLMSLARFKALPPAAQNQYIARGGLVK